MGLFDKFKKKASDLAKDHPDKADQGIESTGDFIDQKTGGKHKGNIDKAQQKAREMFNRSDKSRDRDQP